MTPHFSSAADSTNIAAMVIGAGLAKTPSSCPPTAGAPRTASRCRQQHAEDRARRLVRGDPLQQKAGDRADEQREDERHLPVERVASTAPPKAFEVGAEVTTALPPTRLPTRHTLQVRHAVGLVDDLRAEERSPARPPASRCPHCRRTRRPPPGGGSGASGTRLSSGGRAAARAGSRGASSVRSRSVERRRGPGGEDVVLQTPSRSSARVAVGVDRDARMGRVPRSRRPRRRCARPASLKTTVRGVMISRAVTSSSSRTFLHQLRLDGQDAALLGGQRGQLMHLLLRGHGLARRRLRKRASLAAEPDQRMQRRITRSTGRLTALATRRR